MKRLQIILLFGLLLAFVLYGIRERLSEKFDYRYQHDSRYQVYNVDDPPARIHFAGEDMPLDDEYVRKKFERELRVQTYWNYSRVALIKRARHWLPQMEPILKQHGIPEDFKYLSVIESMLMNVQSPVSAAGFWQIMANTGRNYGLEINDEVDERYHPIKATHVACRYFKDSYKMFGNWTSVAASYNSGIWGLSAAYRRQGQDSFYKLRLNPQTATYVFRAVAVKQLLEHPKEYGYKLTGNNPYAVRLKKVPVTESISDLPAFAAQHGIALSTLKQHNPWLMSTRLTIKEPGKTYTLLIPRKPEMIVAATPQGASTPIDSLSTVAVDTLGLVQK